MSSTDHADPMVRRALGLEYLAELDTREPGSASVVDRDEFLREYAGNVCTLDEAFGRARARKNQREADLRKKLRHGGK